MEISAEPRAPSLYARTVRRIARFLGRRIDTPAAAWWDRDLPFRTARVHGHDLCYVTAGQGPPVLLVHGFGTSLSVWAPQIRGLSNRFQVFAVDLPGHGYSEKPDVEYGLRFYLDSLSGFLDAVGISSAAFVGHSMGGLLTLCLAAEVPDRVRRLVLVNSSSPLSRPEMLVRFHERRRRRPWLWNRVLELVELLIPLLPASLEARSRKKTVYNTGAVPVEWTRRMGAFRRSRGFARMAVSTMGLWQEALAYQTRLRAVGQPALLICGAEDRVIPPPDSRRLLETLPEATMEVFPDCGHVTPLEAPDRTTRSILGFLLSQDSRAVQSFLTL